MSTDRSAIAAVIVSAAVAACSPSRSSSSGDATCAEAAASGDHRRAASICARELDTAGSSEAGLAAAKAEDALGRKAEAHQLRGRVHLAKRSFDDAERELRAAMELHRTGGDHAGLYRDTRFLADMAWARSDYRTALAMAEASIAEATTLGDAAKRTRALLYLGNLLQAVGDDVRALEIYDQAEPLLPADDKAGRANLLVYKAHHLERRGQRALATQHLLEARSLAAEIGNHPLVLAAEVNLANIAIVERRLDDAAAHLEAARAAWRASGDPAPSVGIALHAVLLARARGDAGAAARAIAELAIDDPPPELGWMLAQERGALAQAGGRLDEAERSYRQAIAIVEEMRRTGTAADVRAPFLEDRWEPYESLFGLQLARGAVDDAFATMSSAQGRMFLDELTAAAGDAQPPARSPAHAAIRRLVSLDALAPALESSTVAPGETSPAATLAALRGRHVLAYFAGAGSMRLLVVKGGRPIATGVSVDLAELDRLVDDFVASPDDAARSRALARAILPAEALPPRGGRLHIVPIGPLLRVSFAALLVDDERLVARHEIVYAPSVTGLAALASAPGDAGDRADAVVLADARRDLAHARAELDVVVGRTGARALAGAEADSAALRSAAGAGLLHIAGHSAVGSGGGYLVLSDGNVTAADVLSWRLRPRLAVLPTCASAVTHSGEMWGSLAAAFLAAGSRDVVATLASVEDAVAAEFTRLFYQHGGIDDPVRATARAQRDLAARHPVSAWSAFIVAGL